MTHTSLVLSVVLFMAGSSMLAQSRDERRTSDAISGTWTGELLRQNTTRPVSVSMELTFDGKSVVSGTVSGLPNPADIKAGSYDPKNGALKLQLGKQGEGAILLTLEGKVVKGAASGVVTGDATGTFAIRKIG
jgi:hypothetical protein